MEENEKIDLYLYLFETGKEIASQYDKYDGDMDWSAFVEDRYNRSHFDEELEDYIKTREREAMRKMADAIKNEMPDIEIAKYGLGNTPHSIIDEVYARLTDTEYGKES